MIKEIQLAEGELQDLGQALRIEKGRAMSEQELEYLEACDRRPIDNDWKAEQEYLDWLEVQNDREN